MTGCFQINIIGQIVFIDVIGQWSEQTALNFEKAMHKCIPDINQNTFAHVVSFEHWELSTPSVEPIIKRVVGWCAQQGLCASAEVFSADVLKEYLLNKSVEEVKGKVTIQRFSDTENAIAWLAEIGFTTKTYPAY